MVFSKQQCKNEWRCNPTTASGPIRNLNRRPAPAGALLVSVDSSASLYPPPAALRLRHPFTREALCIMRIAVSMFPDRIMSRDGESVSVKLVEKKVQEAGLLVRRGGT